MQSCLLAIKNVSKDVGRNKKTKRTSSTQQATSGAERPLRLRPLNSRSRPMKIQKAFSFLVAAPITEVYRNMVC